MFGSDVASLSLTFIPPPRRQLKPDFLCQIGMGHNSYRHNHQIGVQNAAFHHYPLYPFAAFNP